MEKTCPAEFVIRIVAERQKVTRENNLGINLELAYYGFCRFATM